METRRSKAEVYSVVSAWLEGRYQPKDYQELQWLRRRSSEIS